MKPTTKRYVTANLVDKVDEEVQRILHSQEVPPLEREEGCFNLHKPYEGTVWVHLDEHRQTMMLPEDW